jgi:Na+-transporting methylmalonyl-CoA/oxaloacetate decarboxylase gamma subunit
LEPPQSIETEKSPSSESSSRKGSPEQVTTTNSVVDPAKLESEKAVKLNVNASSVGAMVGHEHAGSLENSRRSQPTWAGMSFVLIFLTLSAVMIYLVLDLSDMLPHSKKYGQLPDPVASGTSQTAPTAGETSAAAVAGTISPVKEPSNVEQSAGVFKVDPDSLFPGPLASNENVRPGLDSRQVTGSENSASEETLSHKEASEEEAGASLAGDPAAVGSVGALIDEQDIKVTGEVSLPPLIDLNPSRNALPAQTSGPSAPTETLALFLAARSLNERRPYMTDSRRSEAELERGPLAKKLPSVVQQRLLKYMKDHSEKTDERFFEISFERESTAPILVQVNAGSDGRMRVHTDAFLDLYNDEMARFQAVPVKGERTFYTLADAYKQCFEEKIPGAEDKSYIKLRQHEQVTARLQAYFAKDSEISQQIGQSKALPWGRSGICTVTVKWNTDYGRPYVELVRIDDLSWAP